MPPHPCPKGAQEYQLPDHIGVNRLDRVIGRAPRGGSVGSASMDACSASRRAPMIRPCDLSRPPPGAAATIGPAAATLRTGEGGAVGDPLVERQVLALVRRRQDPLQEDAPPLAGPCRV